MNGLARVVIAVSLMVGVASGCGGLTSIPSGAQQVHIADTETSLDLQPTTVHAGDVYIVLDGPRQNVLFARQKRTAEATPGPMSDADLERLRHGDTEGTSIEGISVTGSAEQQAAARGKVGYCGNVYRFLLAPGKYAFLLDPPDGDPPQPVPPGSMAILEVTP